MNFILNMTYFDIDNCTEISMELDLISLKIITMEI